MILSNFIHNYIKHKKNNKSMSINQVSRISQCIMWGKQLKLHLKLSKSARGTVL